MRLGATHEPHELLQAMQAWAKTRKLDLTEADVPRWQEVLRGHSNPRPPGMPPP